MKSGEVWVLVSLIVLVVGGLFSEIVSMPEPAEASLENADEAELPIYEILKQSIQPYHFGGLPLESLSGDTTVWKVDLDYNMYSLHQANLEITRILRNLNFENIFVRERSAGGMIFSASFPDGQLIKIHFKNPY